VLVVAEQKTELGELCEFLGQRAGDLVVGELKEGERRELANVGRETREGIVAEVEVFEVGQCKELAR